MNWIFKRFNFQTTSHIFNHLQIWYWSLSSTMKPPFVKSAASQSKSFICQSLLLLLRENLTRVRHILAEPPFGVLKPARRGRTLLESESRAVTAAVSLAYSSQVRRTFLHTYMLGHPHTLPTTCVPYTYYYTYYTYTLYW